MTLIINTTNWQADKDALTRIRDIVFIQEQKVPEYLELDEHDKIATHFIALNITSNGRSTTPIGCCRILPSGKIGRLAVLKDFRGRGIGTHLLLTAIKHAKQQQCSTVYLDAQISAKSFYYHEGFVEEGDIFLDAGIEHIRMRKVLT